MRNVKLSDAELNRIEREIAELAARRDEIKKKDLSQTAVLLRELKNCKFEVYREAIRLRPSRAMNAVLPHCGSQDSFEFPLTEKYHLDCSDYGVLLMSEKRDKDRLERLKWLSKQGVARDSVSYYNEGHGSVKSCEYYLKKAVEERDEVLVDIAKAFA